MTWSRKNPGISYPIVVAHKDLGHFEEAHHWNMQAKFYNEKFPLVYESDKIGLSIMKIMVLL